MTTLLAALLAGAAGPASAADWLLGFKAGLSSSDLGGGDVEEEVGNRNAFAGGLFAQANASRNFGIRLEGLYHMKGAAEDVDDGGSLSLELDYVEFPILLMGRVPASESLAFNAFAGPVIALNTGANATISDGDITVSGDIGDGVADFEFALVFGLGAEIQAGSVVISLDGRYQLCLTTVDDGLGTDVFGETEDLDVMNRSWVVMAGVGFPLGAH
jgi:hypothetical protein